jgi:hypothetical protein
MGPDKILLGLSPNSERRKPRVLEILLERIFPDFLRIVHLGFVVCLGWFMNRGKITGMLVDDAACMGTFR